MSPDRSHDSAGMPKELLGGVVSLARRPALWGWAVLMVPLLAWSLALWPAVMTTDSMDTWNQAAVGPVVAWHPPTYTYLQRVAYLIVGSPAAVVLLQCAAMAWALRRLLDASVVLGLRRWFAYGFGLLVAALPPVGAFTAHVWKDVPFSIGFLLVTSWLVGQLLVRLGAASGGRRSSWSEAVVLALGLLLVLTMRQNGPYLVILVAAPLVVVALQRRVVAAVVAGALAVSIVVASVLYPAIGVREAPEFVRGWLYMYDLGSLYRSDPGAIPEQARESLEAYATPGEYRRDFNCHWAGNTFQSRFYEPEPISVPELTSAWRKLVLSDPLQVAGNHLCGASPTWNPWPAPEELSFRETVVDYVVPNPQGVRSDPVSDRLGAAARDLMRRIGRSTASQVVFWRAATWMWVLAGLLVAGAVRHRRPMLLWVLAPFVALSASVIAFAGPHYRYMAPGWIGAVLLLPLAIQVLRMSAVVGETVADPAGVDPAGPDPEVAPTHEADHPDPLLQRGGDVAGDAG